MIRKLLTIGAIAMLTLSLAACGDGGTADDGGATEPMPTTATVEEAPGAAAPVQTDPGGGMIVRATEMADYDVFNLNGEDLGDTEDMMITLSNGEIDYLVLSFGGFLGLGEQNFLIPWEAVDPMPETEAFVAEVLTEESLAQAPVFEADAWPDTSVDDWDAEIRSYWQGLGIEFGDDTVSTPEAGASGTVTDTETITDTTELEVTPEATEEADAEASGTVTNTETMTGTGAVTPEATEEADAEASGTVTDTETMTGTGSVTPEATEEADAEASGTVTNTETMTSTGTVTPEATEEADAEASGTVTDTETMTGTGAVTPEATGTVTDTAGVETTPSAEGGEGVDVQLPRSVRMSVLLDYPVRNPAGEDIGQLEDLMINWQEGKVAYAVLSFGEFLGMGGKWFAIPLSSMTFNPIDQIVVIDIEPEMLEAAPGFDQNNWPLSADPDWDVEIRNFWEERQRELDQMLTPVDPATGGEAPGAVATPTTAP